MQLIGSTNSNYRRFYGEMLVILDNVHSQSQALADHRSRAALDEMLTSLKSIYVSIFQLCAQEVTSSQAVFALLRTLFEAMLSALAVCKDVEDRSVMFDEFAAVLDWKLAVADAENVGTYGIPSTPEHHKDLQTRKCQSEAAILASTHS